VKFIFTPWRAFMAFRDKGVDARYLRDIGVAGVREFKAGISSPKSGRVYRRRGRMHKASAPGEFPAKDTGRHVATVNYKVGAAEVTIGSGMFYARFLRYGTRKMAPRKMSQNALENAMQKGVQIGHFARFKYV
jgi:hypothetical protein